MLLVGMGGAGRVGGVSSTLLRCIVAVVAVVAVVVGVGVIGVVVGVEVVGVVSPCGSTAKQFCWGQSIVLVVSSDTCVGRQKRQMSIAVAVGGLWTVPAGMRRPLHVCSTAETKSSLRISSANKKEHKTKKKTEQQQQSTIDILQVVLRRH
jgi:hypothetical protein